ncbi:TonB-dependent receptor [Sphingomonas sp. DG1-23]|uniref:TonB-dependent receptor domain-containing protein n=1 Tax=Sphingomonas sp. DG1-23 TaxID=3068316 RepID=UPI00274004CA|nr:TonB-dependent receptor [Sphingomonas sp. DG1-23]MDP5279267.1 TonB-dependent receptor [Sphingomonas sp. DG1-23]
MKKYLLAAVAPFAMVSPALAKDAPAAPSQEAEAAPAKKGNEEVFSTGVAKGRDRLDSATSTSALRASEIEKIGARSIAEILRDIPGIRAEASTGEGSANITIRGLPIASSGAKFLQLQEDGLPILEFGDIAFATADTFLRADLNLAAVEAIRGGSASTFASNSPGGIVNFISKTGDTEGGAVQLSTGLDYGMRRIDFDYGTHVTPTLRFHVGGFWRDGEGPRATGVNSTRGGQIKLNVTKEFEGGYVRFYGKYMDDITPAYDITALGVSGTNDKPVYSNIPGYDARHDSLFSKNFQSLLTLDGNNQPVRDDMTAGQHAVVKSVGVEAKFEVAGFDITERFRYADMSNHYMGIYYAQFVPAAMMPAAFGVPGGSLRYASGPNAGQAVANPTTLNGNGLGALMMVADTDLNSLNNVTNDIRASRVWNLGGNDLTTTVGLYSSHQTIDSDWNWASVLSGVAGDGNAQLLDIVTPTGVKVSQDGTLRYGAPTVGTFRRGYRLGYTTNAPFASVNLRLGGVSLGGSLRYDFGKASGSVIGSELGDGRVGVAARDMNGDGVISVPEMQVAVSPLTRPAPVDYSYGYLSYSLSALWRIAEPVAVFARYSRGGRANADRIQFSPFISQTDGSLLNKDTGVDVVHQAEAGVKFRNDNLTLNVTGFWAKAEDSNLDSITGLPLLRDYKAIGAEFEGSYRTGIFSLTAGATYTDAEITNDAIDATISGNTPQHQAKLVFQATPQITTDRFSVGAVFVGTTGSYATATNTLKVPGFVTTNAFVQFRPIDRVTLAVNASNLFDELAITAIDDAVIPATGVARAHVLNGRTISASVRFDF